MDLFWAYWDKVKFQIQKLRDLPARIRRDKLIANDIIDRARRAGDSLTVGKLQSIVRKFENMIPEANEIAAKIRKYLPEWAAFSSTQPQMGVLSVVLGVAAIAALGVVSVKGLSLLKDYQLASRVLDDAKAGYYTPGQSAAMIASTMPTEAGLFNVKVGGASIIFLALAGVGAYFYFGRAR